MGWENVFHCEWNEFGQKVLKYYWPKAISYADITKTDFTGHRGTIDILSGGFPCQPYSVAGKRKGKEDDRHLWPEMLRAIREIQPSYVVGENVAGLVSWNGGLVFHEVQTDLENEGYEVQPFILPACAKNAPHRRDRVWFVAYSKSNGDSRSGELRDSERSSGKEGHREHIWDKPNNNGKQWATSNTTSLRPYRNDGERKEIEQCGAGREALNKSNGNGGKGFTAYSESESGRGKLQQQPREREFRGCYSGNEFNKWQDFPTQPPVCNGDDGLSSGLDRITFPKWRSESIKAGGNAIVPQIAFEIFKAIDKCTTLKPIKDA